MESIFESVKNAALIHKSGGGTGFSFSRIRPASDCVKTTGGVASGPISFMKVFNVSTEVIKQGGVRRGANMGILRVDHPDILEFITCKKDTTELTNFNISVGITEAFMQAVEKDSEYDLINPRTKKPLRKLKAREVFSLIVEMAWLNGEPGIVFLDRINRDNPTPFLGEIESTNPCGEQPLLPYEACNLGSINLSLFVKDGKIDWEDLGRVVDTAVEFLDNVIDMNQYPLPQIDELAKANRKIGLGVMGFADMLFLLEIPYDSEEALTLATEVMSFIDKRSKEKSQALALERGSFPNFEKSIYKDEYKTLRNATTTTIAPTGSISIIANCSSGIEPLFALSFVRTILDDQRLIEVHPIFKEVAQREGFYSDELMERIALEGSIQHIEEIPEKWRRIFVTAHDITPEWHIRMQAAFQQSVDNAVSKTVNFPNEASKNDIAEVFQLAYQLGCKGVTVYRDGSRQMQVLSTGKTSSSSNEDKDIISPRERPSVTYGRTEKIKTGCGSLYVTINEDENGLCELFARLGKSGGCASSQMDAISRLISLAMRAGVSTEAILKHLRGIRCPSPAWVEGGVVLSCPDAIGLAIENYVKWRNNGNGNASEKVSAKLAEPPIIDHSFSEESLMGACPECGGHMKHEDGCMTCIACGFSRCG